MAAIENIISQAIISKFSGKLQAGLNLDAALVGAGPSALVAARYLADAGLKCALFERKLAPGGGTWGGGMLFNEAVVQQEALPILDDFSIPYEAIPEQPGYYTLDSVAMASGLIFGAVNERGGSCLQERRSGRVGHQLDTCRKTRDACGSPDCSGQNSHRRDWTSQ